MSDDYKDIHSFVECLSNFFKKESAHLQTPQIQASLSQSLVNSFITILHYVEIICVSLSRNIPLEPNKTSLDIIVDFLNRSSVTYKDSSLFIVTPHIIAPLLKDFKNLPLDLNKTSHPDLLERLYGTVVAWRLSNGQ